MGWLRGGCGTMGLMSNFREQVAMFMYDKLLRVPKMDAMVWNGRGVK